jgi:hypothetical protein
MKGEPQRPVVPIYRLWDLGLSKFPVDGESLVVVMETVIVKFDLRDGDYVSVTYRLSLAFV